MDGKSVMAELKDPSTRQAIENWASAWWDLNAAGLMIHSMSILPLDDGHAHLFTKRAIVDGAIAAYGRHFVDGTRKAAVDLVPIVKSFGSNAEETHEEALRWRHKNVAHRGSESQWEDVQSYIVWPEKGSAEGAIIRADIAVTLGPGLDFLDDLQDLCTKLRDHIWENKLAPTRVKYLTSPRNRARLQTIRQYQSRPLEGPYNPGTDSILISLNI